MRKIREYLQPSHNLFESMPITTIIQNHKTIPTQFTTLIKKHPHQFSTYLQKTQTRNATQLQKLALINQLILHTDELNQPFTSLDLNLRCDDAWFNSAVFVPFSNFLRKVIHSEDMYEKVRIINIGWNKLFHKDSSQKYKSSINHNPKEYLNLNVLYYIINLINDLFETLKNISTLGRYYLVSNRPEVEPFVQSACLQLVALYFALKFIIEETLLEYSFYMASTAEGQAFKQILLHDVQAINQRMKQALFSKYFQIVQKGIKTQLFQIEKQREFYHDEITKLVEEYASTKTKRNVIRNEVKILEQRIFGQSSFDNRLFEQSTTLFSHRKFNEQTTEDCDEKENNSHAGYRNRIVSSKKATINNKSRFGSREMGSILFVE